MSTKKETKIQKVFDAAQASEFFHTLGAAITSPDDERLAEHGLPLGPFEKIKLTIKREDDTFILKAKIIGLDSSPSEGESPGPETPGELSYKTLKKRMKGTFAELKKMLTQEAPPSAEMVRRFLDDSDLMITFPGQGDEHYEEYKRCCQEFEKAHESGDLEAMRTTLAAVEVRKKACHKQYK